MRLARVRNADPACKACRLRPVSIARFKEYPRAFATRRSAYDNNDQSAGHFLSRSRRDCGDLQIIRTMGAGRLVRRVTVTSTGPDAHAREL